MDSLDYSSVMRRMAQGARDGADARRMSPAKALRLALAQAADTLFGLAVNVATVEQMRLTEAEVANRLEGEGLLVLLDGARAERAAMRLDGQLLAAMIEVQTTGAVRPGIARARPATPTDAAMVARFVDAVLAQYDAFLMQGVTGHVPHDYRFGDRVEDVRSLLLALGMPDYDLFRLTLDLGSGAKTGQLDLLLPVRAVVAGRARDASGSRARHALAQLALGAPVVLDAVMARVPMTLKEVSALRRGQHIALSREVLGSACLVGTRGHLVAKVHLGQINGWRAVRFLSTETGDLPEARSADQAALSDNRAGASGATDHVRHDSPAQVVV